MVKQKQESRNRQEDMFEQMQHVGVTNASITI